MCVAGHARNIESGKLGGEWVIIPAGDSVLVCVVWYPLSWSSLRDR